MASARCWVAIRLNRRLRLQSFIGAKALRPLPDFMMPAYRRSKPTGSRLGPVCAVGASATRRATREPAATTIGTTTKSGGHCIRQPRPAPTGRKATGRASIGNASTGRSLLAADQVQQDGTAHAANSSHRHARPTSSHQSAPGSNGVCTSHPQMRARARVKRVGLPCPRQRTPRSAAPLPTTPPGLPLEYAATTAARTAPRGQRRLATPLRQCRSRQSGAARRDAPASGPAALVNSWAGNVSLAAVRREVRSCSATIRPSGAISGATHGPERAHLLALVPVRQARVIAQALGQRPGRQRSLGA